jgi:hypothetical protein
MARLRIVVNTNQAGPRLKRSYQRKARAVSTAMLATAEEAGARIVEAGRKDISSAGNFGSRWTQGLQARVGQGGGNYRVTITMGVPYWTVFQFGKVIQGRPLLWIPLSFASDAQGVRARDYPGQLFRVDRAGRAPLLLTPPGIPKYFGKESVTIPKKFHLIEIATRIARNLGPIYTRHFKRAARE